MLVASLVNLDAGGRGVARFMPSCFNPRAGAVNTHRMRSWLGHIWSGYFGGEGVLHLSVIELWFSNYPICNLVTMSAEGWVIVYAAKFH
jgi:hypothetical protein